ncbi:MAG: transglutaminase-like domain-containing protein [Desulfobacterales bacterium]|nr:transglutaminase-like domain-containing protein [Desulfobacterales bacterium]
MPFSCSTIRPYRIGAVVFGLVFALLMTDRVGLIDRLLQRQSLPEASASAVSERSTWMNIFQNNRKIGFSHAVVSREDQGIVLEQTLFMRINTMGMVHSIHLKTEGRMNPDLTLAGFRFSMSSGRFEFSATGAVEGDRLIVQTENEGSRRRLEVPLASKPYLAAGIFDAIWASGIEPGMRKVVPVFDPATMGQEPVTVEVIGIEPVQIMGKTVQAHKVVLDFKGVYQEAWIGEGGEILRQKGFLGIMLEKTDRESALFGLPVEASEDMTEAVSISSNVDLSRARELDRLRVEISGIDLQRLDLGGSRQQMTGSVLTVTKESLEGLPQRLTDESLDALADPYLSPTPFIQSDHPRIRKLAGEVTAKSRTPLERVRLLLAWIHSNIEQRPVVSMPDALATLQNRVGDCNEHAVLMAALARAAGVPAEIEAGLVYLRGRFFYHAWNRVYVGRWITVDALFDQIPADVSHIRLAAGSPEQQVDLMSVIGRVRLTVLEPGAGEAQNAQR